MGWQRIFYKLIVTKKFEIFSFGFVGNCVFQGSIVLIFLCLLVVFDILKVCVTNFLNQLKLISFNELASRAHSNVWYVGVIDSSRNPEPPICYRRERQIETSLICGHATTCSTKSNNKNYTQSSQLSS